jgi:2-hydroxymuconate-semialdehyde hydrolase
MRAAVSPRRAPLKKGITVAISKHEFVLEEIPVAYFKEGAGPSLLLLHGSGPGASSNGYWRSVIGPLSEKFEVHMMDLIGFGMSGRKAGPPYFDLQLWQRQVEAMIDVMPGESIGVIGHSLSATFAIRAAVSKARVGGVLTTGAMGSAFTPNAATKRAWTAPRNRDELKETLKLLAYDPSTITDAYVDARVPVVLAPGYPEYFQSMFSEPAQFYVDAAMLPDSLLAQMKCPLKMIHGRDDVPFPFTSTMNIASRLPHADVTLLAHCGHSVAVEAPQKLIDEATIFFSNALKANSK